MKNKKRKNKKQKPFNMLSFSKKWVTILMCFFILNFLAILIYAITYGNPEMVSSFSPILIALSADMGVTMTGYFCKAFFETKEEEDNKLKREEMNKKEDVCG